MKKTKRLIAQIKRVAIAAGAFLFAVLSAFDAQDLAIMFGLGLIALGLSMVSVPLAFIVPGILIFLLATWRPIRGKEVS